MKTTKIDPSAKHAPQTLSNDDLAQATGGGFGATEAFRQAYNRLRSRSARRVHQRDL